ncbi:MAG: AAA family ATPase [Burkholderiales bacterium]
MLIEHIVAWSMTSLKPWQQDAVRRLFQRTLTANAMDDLYAMLKDGIGLPDAEKRKPEPFARHHVPVTAAPGAAVTMVAMRQVVNVNRLAPDQTLRFARRGLTIIYGGNGSGKSGYARVLKRACRSRGAAEDVRQNALEKPAKGAIPQAVFDIELGSAAHTVKWQKGVPPPTELASVAVFDTYCARAYLDDHQDIAYLPAGLDVVENLAQVVLPGLTEKLSAEIAATSTSTDAFKHLLGTTKVGALIATLSEKTATSDVEDLGSMTPEDQELLASLEKTLNENDPKAKATALKLAAARVKAFQSRIEAANVWVTEEAIQKLSTMDKEAEAAILAEEGAAAALRAGEPLLQGTGDPTWKAMFQAARQFSMETAYPGKPFPCSHDESQCVLCQQPLSLEANERFARFEAFVQANVSKAATEKREAMAAALSKIRNAPVVVELEGSLAEELNQFDAGIAVEVTSFASAIQARHAWLLAAQQAHAWQAPQPLPVNPCVRLSAIVESVTAQEQNFVKATDDKQRSLLDTQLAELKARAALAPHKQSVIDLIGRMKTKALLNKCKDELRTKSISDKAKEFASLTVTAPLRTALEEEFESLGVSMMLPRLDERVEKGKMRHKLALDLEISAEIRDILSEGEQRAIAIGSFLAELRTGNHEGAVVFDDPVSSLDHFRRQNVARRFAELAKVRQVLVFTHDSAFLGELCDLIESEKIEHMVHHLEWEGKNSGKVTQGLPWLHQPYKERIDKLQQAQSKLSKSWPAYPAEADCAAMRTQYSLLRATIERVIQDVIFNGVVVRYRDWIKVGNLGEVVGFSATECAAIESLHKKCCGVVDAHDASSSKNSPVPTAVDLGKDIASLVAAVDAVRASREIRKKAKSP